MCGKKQVLGLGGEEDELVVVPGEVVEGLEGSAAGGGEDGLGEGEAGVEGGVGSGAGRSSSQGGGG